MQQRRTEPFWTVVLVLGASLLCVGLLYLAEQGWDDAENICMENGGEWHDGTCTGE